MTESVELAFGVGVLATVSPCGLAMLPGFRAYYIGTGVSASEGAGGKTETLRRRRQGLRAGVISVGFASVVIATALVATPGLRSVIAAVPWVTVAAVLVAAGIALLAGGHVAMTFRVNPLRSGGRGPAPMLAYGAADAVAALTCSLGVLLALIGGGLTATSLVR